MKRTDLYCDYCNESEGADADQGYARTEGDEFPLGWWEVPGKGRNGTTGHACPQCVMGDAYKDIIERRDADTRRLLA